MVGSRKEEEEAGKQGAVWLRTDTLSGGLGWIAQASLPGYKGTEPDQADIQRVRRMWAVSGDTVRTSPRDFLTDALTTATDLWNICYVR